jgi:signal transduction histidine kinase/HD-like signal output (HDOD) protein
MLNSGLGIRQRIAVARLPAMPHILIKLLDLCQGEDAALDDFADLIIKDAAVTMRMLGAANRSAHAHYGHKPGLRQSLLALGIDTVRTLLIGESVSQVFDSFTNSCNSDLRGYWRHSYTAALAARKIAVMTDYPHLEEAYLAGLLHDVGRLSLLSAAPQEYSTLLSHVDDAGLCVAEKQTFDITHSEAGAWLIGQFSLDSFLADSVLYHHQPVEKLVTAHPLIRTAMLSDLIASHGAGEPALEVAQLFFGLDAGALLNICNDTGERVKETAEFLKIDLSGTEQAMAVPYPSRRANNDGDTRDQLAIEVQHVILASETRRSFFGADSEAGVMSAIAKSAELQFGFENVLFMMRDEAKQCLQGVALESFRQNVSEFSIPLRDGGVVSGSVERRQPAFLDSGSQAINLVEDQLFRLLGAEHLICLPLFCGQHGLGVVIGSVPVYRVAELHARSSFLRIFALQAAAAIDEVRVREDESERIGEKYRQSSRWVVHEVSNPLSIIKNYLAVLDAKVSRKEPVRAEVAILGQEIDRVGQILRGLSDIQMEPPREMLGVKQVVGDVVGFLKVTGFVPPSIRLDTQFQMEAAGIKVDSNALKQILVNLIKNAVEAIQENGEIVVAIPGYINRDGRLYCALTIHDNGPGIAPPVLAKLFSPVRSTKGGDHAGLGLSIVHSLVRDIEGAIMCRSNGSGTTFELLLPVDAGADIDGEEDVLQSRKSIGGRHGRS